MIVADTTLIAHLYIDGDFSLMARQVFQRDSDWIAPAVWRSEFRNVLANHLRVGMISIEQAKLAMNSAEYQLNDGTYQVQSDAVLDLVATTKHSAYDCEFVVLAQARGTRVVTSDRRMLKIFPSVAISPAEFVNLS